MRLLVLSEGNPEDPSASGSGTPKSVIDGFRARGDTVTGADVELYGLKKAACAFATWSPRRGRWRAKYRLLAPAFGLRSRNAVSHARAARENADLILQYGGTFNPGRSGVPYFLYCDSNTKLSAREPHSWGAALSKQQLDQAIALQADTYRAAAGIFAFSDYVRNSFVSDFGIPAERVHTVYAGPNFDPSRIEKPASRGSEGPPTILFVGREFQRKGGETLLDAFRLVRERVPDARLLIVGPADQVCDMPGVEQLGYLRKSVPSEAARLESAYRSANVFCLPTRHEPFGIVVLEAMFHGLPVVASRIWAIPEMVSDGKTGYTVPPLDAAGFADRLAELLTNSERALALGTAGRNRAIEQFTWSSVVDRMARQMTSHVKP